MEYSVIGVMASPPKGQQRHTFCGFVYVVKDTPIAFTDAKAGEGLKSRNFTFEQFETFPFGFWINGEFIKPFEDALLFLFRCL